MRRPIIAGLLLLCAGISAKADQLEVKFRDIGPQRSDAELQADAKTCDAEVNVPYRVVSAAYKKCMLALGHRFLSAHMISSPEVEDGKLVCSAKVLRAENTGWALNHHPLFRLTFRISARGSKPYETTVSKEVSWHNPPRPGQTLRVYCDPANPGEVHPAG